MIQWFDNVKHLITIGWHWHHERLKAWICIVVARHHYERSHLGGFHYHERSHLGGLHYHEPSHLASSRMCAVTPERKISHHSKAANVLGSLLYTREVVLETILRIILKLTTSILWQCALPTFRSVFEEFEVWALMLKTRTSLGRGYTPAC